MLEYTVDTKSNHYISEMQVMQYVQMTEISLLTYHDKEKLTYIIISFERLKIKLPFPRIKKNIKLCLGGFSGFEK